MQKKVTKTNYSEFAYIFINSVFKPENQCTAYLNIDTT